MRARGVNQQTRPAFVKQRAHAQRGRCTQPDANRWRPCASRAPLPSLAGLGAGAQAFANHDGDESALRSAPANAAGPYPMHPPLANVFQPLINVFEAILKVFHDHVGLGWGLAITALTVLIRSLL